MFLIIKNILLKGRKGRGKRKNKYVLLLYRETFPSVLAFFPTTDMSMKKLYIKRGNKLFSLYMKKGAYVGKVYIYISEKYIN